MEYKKRIRNIFLLALLGFALSFVFFFPNTFGVCRTPYIAGEGPYAHEACQDSTDDSIGGPLFTFGIALLVISSILFFRPEVVFISWWKFTRVYLPVALALIVFSSGPQGGGNFGLGSGPGMEDVVWFTAGLFLLISLGIIIVKSRKVRSGDAATQVRQ